MRDVRDAGYAMRDAGCAGCEIRDAGCGMMNDIMIKMTTIANEIRVLVADWEPKLLSLREEVISSRRNSQDRTIRQIVGHLADSASNNTHRVIHLQYQQSPFSFPNYATSGNNDRWIAIQDYQHEDWQNLVGLWKFSLLHFCHVTGNVREDKLENRWIAGPGRHITLERMILDFPGHLKLHLDEISELVNP